MVAAAIRAATVSLLVKLRFDGAKSIISIALLRARVNQAHLRAAL